MEIEDLYHNTPVGMCVLDRDLRFFRINERLAEINGIPAADHIGKSRRDMVPTLADEVEPRCVHSGDGRRQGGYRDRQRDARPARSDTQLD